MPMKPGPNLLDVNTRRDHEWLVRWIQEPDKMLAEKDPIAIELFEAYNKLPMPNLRITEKEVDMLLDYIQTESRRMKKIMEVEAIAAQQDVEVMDCCQKNEEMVIDSDSDTITDDLVTTVDTAKEPTEQTPVDQEVVLSSEKGEAISSQPASSSSGNMPRPLSLISWACGLGLSILAFRARMAPRD